LEPTPQDSWKEPLIGRSAAYLSGLAGSKSQESKLQTPAFKLKTPGSLLFNQRVTAKRKGLSDQDRTITPIHQPIKLAVMSYDKRKCLLVLRLSATNL
jgi:hypothetical protein